MQLKSLTPESSIQLLRTIATTRYTDVEAGEIVRLCAYLPLPIRTVASAMMREGTQEGASNIIKVRSLCNLLHSPS